MKAELYIVKWWCDTKRNWKGILMLLIFALVCSLIPPKNNIEAFFLLVVAPCLGGILTGLKWK